MQWHEVMTHFTQWVKILRDEITTPDLWDEMLRLARDSDLAIVTEGRSNTEFSPDELQQIEENLRRHR